MKKKFLMKLSLGDWSEGGHGKLEEIFLLSDYDVKTLQAAYKESCRKTGLVFHSVGNTRTCDLLPGIDLSKEPWREIWGDWNENWICPEAERILTEANILDPKDIPETGLYNTDDAFDLIMRFIAFSMPKDFVWDKVTFNVKSINTGERLTMGYGLFVD